MRKTSIILNDKEFEVFLSLSEYILTSEDADDSKALKTGEKYYTNIAKLFGYDWRYIANWYSSGKIKFTKYYFDNFCKNYFDFLNKSKSIQQPKNKKYYKLFLNLVVGVCEREGLDNPIDKNLIEYPNLVDDYPLIYRSQLPSDFIIDKIQQLPTEKDFHPAFRAILSFYKNIQHNEYQVAYEFLSLSGKVSRRWLGNYVEFKKDWVSSPIMHDPEICEFIEFSDKIVEFKISYIVNRFVGILPHDLPPISNLTINEINELNTWVDNLKDWLEMIGLKKTISNEITLSMLFDKDFDVKVASEIGLEQIPIYPDPDLYFVKHLLRPEKVNQYRCDQCICKLENGIWLISNIRDASFATKEYKYVWPHRNDN